MLGDPWCCHTTLPALGVRRHPSFPCFVKELRKGDPDLVVLAAFVCLCLGLRCLKGVFLFSHGKVLLFGSKPGAYWCVLFLVTMRNCK